VLPLWGQRSPHVASMGTATVCVCVCVCVYGPRSGNTSEGEIASDGISPLDVVVVVAVSGVCVVVTATTLHTRSAETSLHAHPGTPWYIHTHAHPVHPGTSTHPTHMDKPGC